MSAVIPAALGTVHNMHDTTHKCMDLFKTVLHSKCVTDESKDVHQSDSVETYFLGVCLNT